jgi:hypothetical protein
MIPFELFKADGTATGIWACGKCKLIVHGYDAAARQRAEECCTPGKCRECGAEKAEADKCYTACRICQDRKDAEKLQVRIAAAEKLDTWDGWVFWDGLGDNDGFFQHLDGLLEWWEDEEHAEGDELPAYIFCCKTIPFRKADVDEVIERCTEDTFEDAADQIEGKDELALALEAFNTANVGLVSYEPDWKRMVKVPITP